jgi:hypothetical protein
MRRICPHPIPWNTIYEQLLRVAQERPELPKPPGPLILNGWVFSSDAEKETRWAETLEWATTADCMDSIELLAADDFYSGLPNSRGAR